MNACWEFVYSQGPSGRVGHEDVFGRISRRIKMEGGLSENVCYNSESPLAVLVRLAIDDGLSSRGHRDNMFRESAAYVGIYTGMHSVYGSMTCFDFTGSNRQLNV